MDENDRLYTPVEAGDYLRRPVETLKHWRKVKRGPKYVLIGRSVCYRRSDLDAFIEANVQVPA